MDNLKIIYTTKSRKYINSNRELILSSSNNYTDVCVAVLTDSDLNLIDSIYNTKFGIPIFVILENTTNLSDNFKTKVDNITLSSNINIESYNKEIEYLAKKYEETMLPPFFKKLNDYAKRGNLQFDCPGHQGGEYFKKHPAGKVLYDFFGENIFKSDICVSLFLLLTVNSLT